MRPSLITKLGGELQRYRDKDFLKAVMAACALMSMADGELHPVELQQIEQAFAKVPELRPLELSKARETFIGFVEALRRGEPDVHVILYRKIQRYEPDFKRSRALLRVAWLVMTADGIDHPAEEKEFKRLCGLLGQDPKRVRGDLEASPGRIGSEDQGGLP
jgi:tellurite resistance protein TerB